MVIFHSHQRRVQADGKLSDYESISFREFEHLAEKFAKALSRLGIQHRDSVGIYSHSSREWQVSSYGIQLLGGITVPVYDSLGPNAATYIINHSECKAVVVHQTKLKDLIESAQNTPKLEFIIIVGSKPDRELVQKVYTFDELINDDQNNDPFIFPGIVPEDVAVIMYTSGSTGTPKGCVLTHKNLVSGGAGFQCLGCSITTSDFVFAFLPLAHIYQMCIRLLY